MLVTRRGHTDDCRRAGGARPCWSLGPYEDTQMTAVAPARRAAMLVTQSLSGNHGHTDDCHEPTWRVAMLVTRNCADTQMTAVVPTAMLVTRSCPTPPPYGHRTGGNTSPRRHMLASQASTRAYLTLPSENVFVIPCPCFYFCPTLSGCPPYRSRGPDETRRPVGGASDTDSFPSVSEPCAAALSDPLPVSRSFSLFRLHHPWPGPER